MPRACRARGVMLLLSRVSTGGRAAPFPLADVATARMYCAPLTSDRRYSPLGHMRAPARLSTMMTGREDEPRVGTRSVRAARSADADSEHHV